MRFKVLWNVGKNDDKETVTEGHCSVCGLEETNKGNYLVNDWESFHKPRKKPGEIIVCISCMHDIKYVYDEKFNDTNKREA